METEMTDHNMDDIWSDILTRYYVVRDPGGMTRREYAIAHGINYHAAVAVLEKAVLDGLLRRVEGVGSAGAIIYYPVKM